MITADAVRLRLPLVESFTGAQMEVLDQHPVCQRKLRRLQPPLLRAHRLPLCVSWWDDLPDKVYRSLHEAVTRWNWEMGRRTSVRETFRLVPNTYLGIDLVVGTRMFSWEEVDFGSVAAGAYGEHSFGNPVGGSEIGECTLYWDKTGKVMCGKIFVPPDLSDFDTAATLAHELGHGLLLGHSPNIPAHLMYRKHTGVDRPKKKECRWVAEIWRDHE